MYLLLLGTKGAGSMRFIFRDTMPDEDPDKGGKGSE